MERILLFLWATATGGFMIAGVVDLSRDSRTGWLYLLLAAFAMVPVWISWRRLAASMRDGGAGSKSDDLKKLL